jgi:translation initiation factor 2B subunit (eIF-2B alpha/beta/delta family)
MTGRASCDRLSGKAVRQEIISAVKRIREDRDHGARQLALEALRALAEVAPGASGEELRECARALVLARPMMAAIENAMALAWERYEAAGDAGQAVADAIERLEAAADGMAATARGVIPRDTLITLTYSSAVIEVLGRLRPRHVIVSESRPLHEGLRMARALAGQGISLTLITEAQMALFVREAEAVVVGADSVRPDGSFVNKVGTHLLALAARAEKVPLYVLADTLKVAAPSQPQRFAVEEGERREVTRERWLEVRNVYFEVTPARLVTAYVTEEGVRKAAAMHGYAAEAERRWRALVG